LIPIILVTIKVWSGFLIKYRRYEMSQGRDKGGKAPVSKPESKPSKSQAPKFFPGVSMKTYLKLAERTRFVTQTHIREE
jgi:hypothetical protein